MNIKRTIKNSGAYFLIIEIEKPLKIREWEIKEGTYLYAGRAKRGLLKRIERHKKKKDKKLRWHIDYITSSPHACVKGVILTPHPEDECRIARKLSKNCEFVEKFGCSDCRCNSHLFSIKVAGDNSLINQLKRWIGSFTYIHF